MAIWQTLASLIGRRSSLAQPDSALREWLLGGEPAASGVTVNEQTALTYSAVYAAIRVLAETVASLPLHVYRQDGRSKVRATDHPLYDVLHSRPNPVMTSFELRETMMGHLLTGGNAYAEVVRDRAGRVIELWPLRWDRMRIVVGADGRTLHYMYRDSRGQEMEIPEVLHIRGLSGDGVVGYSPIRLAREAIGLGLATEKFGASYFGNGAQPGGVLKTPNALSEKARQNLRESWEATHRGPSRAHRVAILEEGLEWQQIGIPPEDSQFLETRRFQVSEIARIFRIPPHLLGDLERATFSNIEQQSIEFVVHSVRPWLVRWEQAIEQRLMTEEERRAGFYVRFNVDGLLRGDIKSRYEAYAIARQWGWYSANDIREKEDEDPIEGGDEYLVPLNMVPAGQASPAVPPQDSGGNGARMRRPDSGHAMSVEFRSPDERAAEIRRRLRSAYAPAFERAAKRVTAEEVREIRKLARRTLASRAREDFESQLIAYLTSDEHRGWVARQVEPVHQAYAHEIAQAVADEVGHEPDADRIAQAAAGYTQAYPSRHTGQVLGAVRGAVEQAYEQGADPLEAVEATLDELDEAHPQREAQHEVVRMDGAIAKAVYAAAGILALRWAAVGESCPYCQHLDGRRVGINEWFVQAGQELMPPGTDSPLVPHSHIGHPPIHDGCDCVLLPG